MLQKEVLILAEREVLLHGVDPFFGCEAYKSLLQLSVRAKMGLENKGREHLRFLNNTFIPNVLIRGDLDGVKVVCFASWMFWDFLLDIMGYMYFLWYFNCAKYRPGNCVSIVQFLLLIACPIFISRTRHAWREITI